jgi:hypothetical protein
MHKNCDATGADPLPAWWRISWGNLSPPPLCSLNAVCLSLSLWSSSRTLDVLSWYTCIDPPLSYPFHLRHLDTLSGTPFARGLFQVGQFCVAVFIPGGSILDCHNHN